MPVAPDMWARGLVIFFFGVCTCDALLMSIRTDGHVPRSKTAMCLRDTVNLASVAGSLVLAMPCSAEDIEAGEKIFTANCAACHAGGKNVIVADHTLEKDAIQRYLEGGFNEKSIIYQITNGKNAMPAFQGRLSEQDIANVASYVVNTAENGWD